MRLIVYPDSSVVVTAPRFFGLQSIERFVMKHSEWVNRKVAETSKHNVIRVARKDIAMLKERSLAYARARCANFAAAYGLKFRKISIRAQKSRWGSCSRSGNLSFNYKIAVLPTHTADYIIVHELCHLREMNHSKKFWDLVAQEIPNHRQIRKELRNIAIVYY